jgi:hypothetical protein
MQGADKMASNPNMIRTANFKRPDIQIHDEINMHAVASLPTAEDRLNTGSSQSIRENDCQN